MEEGIAKMNQDANMKQGALFRGLEPKRIWSKPDPEFIYRVARRDISTLEEWHHGLCNSLIYFMPWINFKNVMCFAINSWNGRNSYNNYDENFVEFTKSIEKADVYALFDRFSGAKPAEKYLDFLEKLHKRIKIQNAPDMFKQLGHLNLWKRLNPHKNGLEAGLECLEEGDILKLKTDLVKFPPKYCFLYQADEFRHMYEKTGVRQVIPMYFQKGVTDPRTLKTKGAKLKTTEQIAKNYAEEISRIITSWVEHYEKFNKPP